VKWKEIRHRILLVLVPTLGSWLLRFILGTLRMRVIGRENADPFRDSKQGAIFVFWHSRILYMLVADGKKWRVYTMVSKNRDGEYIARVAAKFGRLTVRGSSSRGGGRALMQMAKILETGDSVAFTPDGPRGPREVFQPGAVHLSRMTGRPIVPVTYSVRRRKRFASWDGFMLPYPFSRGVFMFGEPLWPGDFPEGDAGLEAMRCAAETALRKLTEQADSLVSE